MMNLLVGLFVSFVWASAWDTFFNKDRDPDIWYGAFIGALVGWFIIPILLRFLL